MHFTNFLTFESGSVKVDHSQRFDPSFLLLFNRYV